GTDGDDLYTVWAGVRIAGAGDHAENGGLGDHARVDVAGELSQCRSGSINVIRVELDFERSPLSAGDRDHSVYLASVCVAPGFDPSAERLGVDSQVAYGE